MNQRLCCIVCSLALLCFSSLHAQWKQTTKVNGTGYQYVQSFTVLDTRVFAATMGGGVYFSSSSGTKWSQINTGLKNLDISTAIVYDQKVIVGAADGLYFSNDKGGTWNAGGEGLGGVKVKTLAVGTNVLFALSDGGFSRSEDGGQHWLPCTNGAESLNPTCISTSGERVLIGLVDGSVLRSLDQGVTWKNVGVSLPQRAVQSVCFAADVLIVAMENNGLFSSVDDGVTWTDISAGLPATAQTQLLSFSGNIFLSTDSQGLWLSADKGQHWIDISDGLSKIMITAMSVVSPTMFVGLNDGSVWKRDITEVLGGAADVETGSDVGNLSVTVLSNPCSDVCRFRIHCSSAQTVHFSVIDMLANEFLLDSQTLAAESSSELNFSTSAFSTGVYRLRMQTAGCVTSIPFVVRH